MASNAAVYAVVDMSKKKKNREKETAENPMELASPVYALAGRDEDLIAAPEEYSEYSMITLDNLYSTEKKNESLREIAPASTNSGNMASKIAAKKDTIQKVNGTGRYKSYACTIIFIVAVALGTLSIIILSVEIAKLKASSSQQASNSPNIRLQLEQIRSNISNINDVLENTNSSIVSIESLLYTSIGSLNSTLRSQTQQLLAANTTLEDYFEQLGEVNATLGGKLDKLNDSARLIYQQVANLGIFILSCNAASQQFSSGYYWTWASNGSAVRVYCDMTRSCGNITGGWTRVAELNMTNSSHQCPSGLTLRTESDCNIRACVTASTVDCVSIPIDIPYSYSRVCGRVIAYQVGATNAFHHQGSSSATINNTYVDGVSLTHGNPREHIWTFAAGLRETMAMNAESTCPCTGNTGATPPPSFVGSDYFCEAGVRDRTPTSPTLYSNDSLWDGDGCTDTNPCCSFNNPPWFYKQLPQPTTDNIEMRVCKNEPASNEDVAIEIVEIYVQ